MAPLQIILLSSKTVEYSLHVTWISLANTMKLEWDTSFLANTQAIHFQLTSRGGPPEGYSAYSQQSGCISILRRMSR